MTDGNYLFDPEHIEATATPIREGTPESHLDKYLARTIRRITLFFQQSDYDRIVRDAEAASKDIGVSNHSELFEVLIREHNSRKPPRSA